MNDDVNEGPIELEEPDRFDDDRSVPEAIWMRGLFMIVFGLLFALAETVLWVVALVQFLWMLFAKEKNELLTEFGVDLGKWLARVAKFQTGATEDKPFPWDKWGA